MNSVITLRTLAGALCTAAIASMATIASAAMPPTSAGSLDPTFGTGGGVIYNPHVGKNDENVPGGAVQSDGKLVVVGETERGDGNYALYVTRFNNDGTLDPAFAGTGNVTLAIDQDSYPIGFGPALDANGRIFIAAGTKPDSLYRCAIVALRPDGSLDPQFGNGGGTRLAAIHSCTRCARCPTRRSAPPAITAASRWWSSSRPEASSHSISASAVSPNWPTASATRP